MEMNSLLYSGGGTERAAALNGSTGRNHALAAEARLACPWVLVRVRRRRRRWGVDSRSALTAGLESSVALSYE